MSQVTLPALPATDHPAPDWARVRADFPILRREVHGYPLCYLDSAATSQKPEPVLAAMERYYRTTNANIHRGVYQLSEEATAQYEGPRARIARVHQRPEQPRDHLHAQRHRGDQPGGRVPGAGPTWGRATRSSHRDGAPQQPRALATARPPSAARPCATSRSTTHGRLVLDDLDRLLDGVKIVAVTQMSNVLGTINPVARDHRGGPSPRRARAARRARRRVPHLPVDVQALDCDFLAFSGHKMLGPTGIGCLYGKRALLEAMPPYHGRRRHDPPRRRWSSSTWNDLPWKFEAGTPADRRSHRPGRRRGLPERAGHGRTSARTSRRSSRPTRSSA